MMFSRNGYTRPHQGPTYTIAHRFVLEKGAVGRTSRDEELLSINIPLSRRYRIPKFDHAHARLQNLAPVTPILNAAPDMKWEPASSSSSSRKLRCFLMPPGAGSAISVYAGHCRRGQGPRKCSTPPARRVESGGPKPRLEIIRLRTYILRAGPRCGHAEPGRELEEIKK